MDQFTNYIIALTNLYGLVSTEKVLEVYNSQNEDHVSLNDLEKYLNHPPDKLKQHHLFIEEGLFVHEAIFLEKESPREIALDRRTLPFYVPEQPELLKYVDEGYFEKNEDYETFLDYLTTHAFEGDEAQAEEVMIEVHDFLDADFRDLKGAMNVLEHYGVPLKDHMGTYLNLIGDYAIHMRLWEYNGYSLDESTAILRENRGKGGASRDEKTEELSLLEKYIISLTHLYGRVTKEKVQEIYNLQNEEPVTLNELGKVLTHSPAAFDDYLVFIERGEYVSEALWLYEDLHKQLLEEQVGKPFYIPEQEELFLYLDPNYIHYPEEFDELVQFLKNKMFKKNENTAYSKAEMMLLALEMGAGPNGAFVELDLDDHVFDNKNDIQVLIDIVSRLNNNTRMWLNNGLTPNELGRLDREKRTKVKKIGRNDPCHCGSGKKYKKCCLQKDRLKK